MRKLRSYAGVAARVLALYAAMVAGNLTFMSCASTQRQSVRHTATVTVVGAHATLAAIQDTESALVCGRPTAPPAGTCVPLELHRQISRLLVSAFILDQDLARAVRAMPVDQPTPANVMELVSRIQKLVNEILLLLPDGRDKTRLLDAIGGAR